jgi:hypothetical protein
MTTAFIMDADELDMLRCGILEAVDDEAAGGGLIKRYAALKATSYVGAQRLTGC